MSSVSSALEHAAHLLPAQGPISIFIHHNTLHAFEDLPFETAVERAAVTFGSEPFLAEARYRDKLAAGRILAADVDAVLTEELKDRAAAPVDGVGTRQTWNSKEWRNRLGITTRRLNGCNATINLVLYLW